MGIHIIGAATFAAIVSASLFQPAVAASVTATPGAAKFTSEQYASGAQRNITVRNISGAPLQLGLISFDGPDAGDFATVSDACSNHNIAVKKTCKIRLQFNATAAFHATESATLSINDPEAVALTSVALTGAVTKKQVWAAMSGLTVTLSNQTQFQYELEPFIEGPFEDTGKGSCGSILGSNHGAGQARIVTCTYVFERTAPGPGSLNVDVTGFTGGHNFNFEVPLN